MKILAVDTSTGTLCLGLSDGEKVCSYDLQLATKISSLLAPTIKRVVESLGWEIEDVDYFCCGVGPGSFTGVRIGLATIKALSWSLDKPAAGIPSLDILAGNAGKGRSYIVPVIDAKRGLVYAAIYRIRDSRPARVSPYMLVSPQELVRKIKRTIPLKEFSASAILGDGLNVLPADCRLELRSMKMLDKDYWRFSGKNLIELAITAVEGGKTGSGAALKPLYLYPKECQIRPGGLKSK